jgi:hypothetical protein
MLHYMRDMFDLFRAIVVGGCISSLLRVVSAWLRSSLALLDGLLFYPHHFANLAIECDDNVVRYRREREGTKRSRCW